jgi:GNAT superfamily N-acetyltransferase
MRNARTGCEPRPSADIRARIRQEDKADEGVWAVTCLVTRTSYRWQGLTYLMIAAAVEFARQHGAHAVEGYAMRTEPGKQITWG